MEFRIPGSLWTRRPEVTKRLPAKDAIAAGAHKPGTIKDDRSVWYERGEESAARRAAYVLAKRKETEKTFYALRPSVAGTRKRLCR
jgi:hypothetical protein